VSPAPDGIRETEVTEWMAALIPELAQPLTFSLIAGGRSNLTFRVEDAEGRAWALRRPPLHHVLPTAHDMSREYRLMHALGPAGIPVPVTVGLCTDEAVNERPFYVMEFVEGHILRSAPEAEAAFDEATRRGVGDHMADTLAALHDVDPDAVGLGDLGRHQGYIERQLKRWYEQFRNSRVDGLDTETVVIAVHDKLAADVPEQQDVAVVHGDFRLDNTVLGDDGSVRAVLDWEICTLGDPLADVGLLMVYWTEPGDVAALVGVTPTTMPGFASRAEVRSWYEARSGRDLSRLDFYVAFGYWKLACILQGVYARYVGGAAAGDRSSVDGFAHSVVTLAEAALSTLESS
jgi:aminoglycoside phosphotransferase (APT) family kinase protein